MHACIHAVRLHPLMFDKQLHPPILLCALREELVMILILILIELAVAAASNGEHALSYLAR